MQPAQQPAPRPATRQSSTEAVSTAVRATRTPLTRTGPPLERGAAMDHRRTALAAPSARVDDGAVREAGLPPTPRAEQLSLTAGMFRPGETGGRRWTLAESR